MAQVWARKYGPMVEWRLARIAECAPQSCAHYLLLVARRAISGFVAAAKQVKPSDHREGDGPPSERGVLELLEASIGSLELFLALADNVRASKRLRKLHSMIGMSLVSALELYAASPAADGAAANVAPGHLCSRARLRDLTLICASINSLSRPVTLSWPFIGERLLPLCQTTLAQDAQTRERCEDYASHFEACFRELDTIPESSHFASLQLELLVWRSAECLLATGARHANHAWPVFVEAQLVRAAEEGGAESDHCGQSVCLALVARLASAPSMPPHSLRRTLALVFAGPPPPPPPPPPLPDYCGDMLQLRRWQLAGCLVASARADRPLAGSARIVAQHVLILLQASCRPTSRARLCAPGAAALARLVLAACEANIVEELLSDETLVPLAANVANSLAAAYAHEARPCLVTAIDCLVAAAAAAANNLPPAHQRAWARTCLVAVVDSFIEHGIGRSSSDNEALVRILCHGLIGRALPAEKAISALSLAGQRFGESGAPAPLIARALGLLAASYPSSMIVHSDLLAHMLDGVLERATRLARMPHGRGCGRGRASVAECSLLIRALMQPFHCSKSAKLYSQPRLARMRALLEAWRTEASVSAQWLLLVIVGWPREQRRQLAPLRRWFVEFVLGAGARGATNGAASPSPISRPCSMDHFEWHATLAAAASALNEVAGITNAQPTVALLDGWLVHARTLEARTAARPADELSGGAAAWKRDSRAPPDEARINGTLVAASSVLTRMLVSQRAQARRTHEQLRELAKLVVRTSEHLDNCPIHELPSNLLTAARRNSVQRLKLSLAVKQSSSLCNILN